ncbi:hypothetical protein ES704_02000 [subsurface metagenome]
MTINIQGKACQANNLVTLCGQPKGSEEFFNRMVKALDITIDRRPKGRPCKRES